MSKKVDPDKKREYNKKQREKKKQIEDLDMMKEYIKVDCIDDDSIDLSKDISEDLSKDISEDLSKDVSKDVSMDVSNIEDHIVLDKKAYEFLLKQAKKAITPITQSVTPITPITQSVTPITQSATPITQSVTPNSENDFFFLIKKHFIMTAKTTIASVLPIIMMQGAMHGAKYMQNLQKQSQLSNTQHQLNNMQTQPTQSFVPVIQTFGQY
jgi:hypothetical protein